VLVAGVISEKRAHGPFGSFGELDVQPLVALPDRLERVGHERPGLHIDDPIGYHVDSWREGLYDAGVAF